MAATKLPILVVDDQPAIRCLLREYLTDLGYPVTEAQDVGAAWAVLESAPVTMVITDVHMPGDSGITLLGRVQERFPDLPVLIMTGKPSIEAAVECIRLGAVDYIPKPFDLEKLRRTITDALARREAQARTARKHSKTQPMPGSESPGSTATGRPAVAGFKILSKIAEGGMGSVYLVETVVDGQARKHALKIIKPELMGAEEADRRKAIQRFRREAELASKVKHPGLVEVVEYGVFGYEQMPYLVMSYAPGVSLDRWIRDNPDADYRDKARILMQVADALQAVHVHGICHRDVKPQNILVNGELTTKLIDFGIARSITTRVTASTQLLGTPAYLAPESFTSEKLDHRADIFSLGIVGYELFLGIRPFSGANHIELAEQIAKRRPVAPRKIRAGFPAELQDVLACMLKKDRNVRYQSMAEVAASLERFAGGAPAGKPKVGLPFFSFDWS
ncbi:MAG: hypothetical protein A3K19_02410 [Lentisphaerae bacterium RIFOXYB12_FULL_65_16]|nr:MAG: hypothetical protein A3K18_13045 [Lentisphaerae bacterium RIFOXYA12_64_32]OGV86730.1 MAG: hypothetical protein A3K19_02410 [Lentisphaerae bacterium RIFOXYB12_FULL_65_16]